MRHLMSPLDLSVEETDKFSISRTILKIIRKNMHMHVPARSLLPAFMSQVPEPDSVLKQLC